MEDLWKEVAESGRYLQRLLNFTMLSAQEMADKCKTWKYSLTLL